MTNVNLKILDNLTDEDIEILCKNSDLNMMVEPIKHNEKYYSKYRKQLGRMNNKSILMQKKLPQIAFELYKKRDMNYLKFFAMMAIKMKRIFESTIYQYMGEEIQLDDVKKFTIDDYKNLIIQIVKTSNLSFNLELFFLQLKMYGVDITCEMKEHIGKEWNFIQKTEQIRKEISDALKKEMKKKEDELERKIITQKDKIQGIKLEVKSLNVEINSKENIIKSLMDDNENLCGELKQQKSIVTSKNNEVEELKKELKRTQVNLEDITGKFQMKTKDIYVQLRKVWQVENEEKIKENIELERKVVEQKQLLKKLELKKEQFESKIVEWEGYIEDYFAKMDQKVIEHRIESLLYKKGYTKSMEFAATSESMPKVSTLYIQKGYKVEKTKVIVDYEDYIDIVESNLSNAGDKMPEGMIYDSFNAAIGARLCPLLCGFGARQRALALTAARYGEKSEIISIPLGFNSINELASAISDTQTHSVIVEDAFGTMNENILLPILRNANGKTIVFTSESKEDLRYLKKHFYNYIQLIVSTKRVNVKKYSLMYSNADNLFKEHTYNCKGPGHKISRKVLEHIGMSNSYVATRGDVLCELLEEGKNNSEDDALYKLFETELKWIIDEKQYEKLVDLIQGNEERYSQKLIECVVGHDER